MNQTAPVYTLQNECNDCYKCIRGCHVKAIRIQNGSASVIEDKCIACGHCVTICPAEAKRVRNDVDVVKALLHLNQKIYVSLAPSWAGVYNVPAEKMIAALKALGFMGVSETALGAQEVSIQTAKMLNQADKGLYISSACPVVDDYIRLYKSDFASNITPLASPALTHCALLKDILGSDIKVVFIGPCVAKKNEATRHPDLMTAALTFDELNFWLQTAGIDLQTISADTSCHFVPEQAYEGSLYPLEGGINETIQRVGITKNDVTFLTVSSLEELDKSLQHLDKTQINKKIFVEALGCAGGCINGPCLSSEKSRILITSDVYARTRYRDVVPTVARTVVAQAYTPAPVSKHEASLEQITKALKKISKHTQEDELNCSGCGYRNCRDFVQALIAGDAEVSMCASYMRKIAVRKAAAVLRCMPAAVVIVDDNMQIVEANESFEHLFLPAEMYEALAHVRDRLKGALIDTIVPFGALFKSALSTGQDIHQDHYAIKDKIYEISIFTVEDNELVGAVISDVTKSEMDRSKIAQRARQVITKNIATVQEIAGLLGEHMVETELLLSSIAEGYDPQSKEGK